MPAEKKPKEDAKLAPMQLWEHLDELRGSLVRVLIILTVSTFVIFAYAEPIVRFLEAPLLKILPPGEAQLYYTGIADKFFIYIKVSVITTIAVLSPYLMWEAWRFVNPGLYQHEKKMILPFIVVGTLSFFAGLCFGYFIVIPYSYEFLINFGSPTDKAIITLTEYFGLTTKLLLIMGCMFELPVIMVLLSLLGIVDAPMLEKHRKMAVFVIAVSAAFITPTPDAFTMLIVMVPLYLLYEASILGVRWVGRRGA